MALRTNGLRSASELGVGCSLEESLMELGGVGELCMRS